MSFPGLIEEMTTLYPGTSYDAGTVAGMAFIRTTLTTPGGGSTFDGSFPSRGYSFRLLEGETRTVQFHGELPGWTGALPGLSLAHFNALDPDAEDETLFEWTEEPLSTNPEPTRHSFNVDASVRTWTTPVVTYHGPMPDGLLLRPITTFYRPMLRPCPSTGYYRQWIKGYFVGIDPDTVQEYVLEWRGAGYPCAPEQFWPGPLKALRYHWTNKTVDGHYVDPLPGNTFRYSVVDGYDPGATGQQGYPR